MFTKTGLIPVRCVLATDAWHLANVQHCRETLLAPEVPPILTSLEEDCPSLPLAHTMVLAGVTADSDLPLKEAGTKEMEVSFRVRALWHT